VKISTVTVSRTIQAKQYEPIVFTVSAELGEGEDPMAVSRNLLLLVKRVLFDATNRMRLDLKPPIDEEMAPLFAEDEARSAVRARPGQGVSDDH